MPDTIDTKNVMPPHLVATILVNWNGVNDTCDCIDSLKTLEYDNHIVIVIDNGSVDDSVSKLRMLYPQVEVIEAGENLGFGRACNLGMKKAFDDGADFAYLLNNDCVVEASTIRQLVTAALAYHADITGSVNYYFNEPERICFAGGTLSINRGTCQHFQTTLTSTPYEVQFVTGAAMLISRKAFSQLHGFDESYFAYFEDADLCLRANKAGFKLMVAPESRVWHKVSRSMGGHESPRQFYYDTRSRLQFVSAHTRGFHKVIFHARFAMEVLRKGAAAVISPTELRRRRFQSVLRGIRDYARGYQGPMPEDV